eukprot:TRINITY_DN20267_c0_g1_i1.p2 TRINITY_DN20267_c0_g1~~TRINITY_DN20267_c0_g1_i1.p2  ORF type:complete len:103 (-),score=13.49 TRINITY_DN20267_c0_g1_i1:9-317(-)
MCIRDRNLHFNRIKSQGAKFISEALKTNRQLAILNLSNNKIGDKGVSSICEALKVKKRGGEAIGEMLRANASLFILNIYLSLIHICRCRRYAVCRSRWSPYH